MERGLLFLCCRGNDSIRLRCHENGLLLVIVRRSSLVGVMECFKNCCKNFLQKNEKEERETQGEAAPPCWAAGFRCVWLTHPLLSSHRHEDASEQDGGRKEEGGHRRLPAVQDAPQWQRGALCRANIGPTQSEAPQSCLTAHASPYVPASQMQRERFTSVRKHQTDPTWSSHLCFPLRGIIVNVHPWEQKKIYCCVCLKSVPRGGTKTRIQKISTKTAFVFSPGFRIYHQTNNQN